MPRASPECQRPHPAWRTDLARSRPPGSSKDSSTLARRFCPPGVGRSAEVVLADRFSLAFSRETQEVYGLKRKSYISDICGEALVVSYLCILFNYSNLHINTDGSYPRD